MCHFERGPSACQAVPTATPSPTATPAETARRALCVLTAGCFIGVTVGGVRGFRGAKEDLKLANSLEFKAAPDGFVQQERGLPGVMALTYSICFYTRATPTIHVNYYPANITLCTWKSDWIYIRKKIIFFCSYMPFLLHLSMKSS